MSKVVLTVSQVRGLLLATAKKDARWYLQGALIDFADRRAVATDGHALIALNIEPEPGSEGQVIVPREDLEAISKGGKATDSVEVLRDGAAVTLIRGPQMINAIPFDADFPQWQNVMPTETSGEPGQYEPDLVARVNKGLRLVLGDCGKYPELLHNGDRAALLCYRGYSHRAIAAVMPWRVKEPAKGATEWLEFQNRGA